MNKIEYWSLGCDILGGPKDRAVKIATAQMPEIAKDIATAMNQPRDEFVSRMVECMKIQNAKNEGSAECAEWIAQDREFAMKTALNQVTAGIGTMVIAGVDPEELLKAWADAVHIQNGAK